MTNDRRVLAARHGRLAVTDTWSSKSWPIDFGYHAAPCSPSPTRPVTSRLGLGLFKSVFVNAPLPPAQDPSRLAPPARAIESISSWALKTYFSQKASWFSSPNRGGGCCQIRVIALLCRDSEVAHIEKSGTQRLMNGFKQVPLWCNGVPFSLSARSCLQNQSIAAKPGR